MYYNGIQFSSQKMKVHRFEKKYASANLHRTADDNLQNESWFQFPESKLSSEAYILLLFRKLFSKQIAILSTHQKVKSSKKKGDKI